MSKRPFAGALRNYITVEQESRTDDGSGGFITAWVVIGLTWAEFKPLSFGERMNQGEVEHVEDFNAIIRGYQDFTLDERLADQYRVACDGKYFRVANIGKKDYRNDWQVVRLRMWGATAQETPVTGGIFDGSVAFNGSLTYSGA